MKNKKTMEIIIDAILLALLIISSKITIATTIISFTLQVLIVLLIILIRDIKHSLIIIGSYLFLGLVLQLPVFSTGGGIGYIFVPSFGFIIGFIVAVVPMKLVQKSIKLPSLLVNIISSVIGIVVIYLFGVIYGFLILEYYLDQHYSFLEILSIFVAPFILIDILKAVIASVVATRFLKIINRGQNEEV